MRKRRLAQNRNSVNNVPHRLSRKQIERVVVLNKPKRLIESMEDQLLDWQGRLHKTRNHILEETMSHCLKKCEKVISRFKETRAKYFEFKLQRKNQGETIDGLKEEIRLVHDRIQNLDDEIRKLQHIRREEIYFMKQAMNYSESSHDQDE